MKNWYDRGWKVHRSPQVMTKVRQLLAKPQPETTVDEAALRKFRRARLEARRKAARLDFERKQLLEAV